MKALQLILRMNVGNIIRVVNIPAQGVTCDNIGALETFDSSHLAPPFYIL